MKRAYIIIILIVLTGKLVAQSSQEPLLFFQEGWKETPAEVPISQHHVESNNLTVQLYGLGKDNLKKSHHKNQDDPYYVWSGLCLGNWMVTLKHESQNVDLTGLAKVKMRTKQSGFCELRVTLKLANGNWLVSDHLEGASKDWCISEFNFRDIKWYNLDLISITKKEIAINPDISNVEEIGFTDLMRGGKSKSSSRLDWIEVYGNPVIR